MRLITSSLVAAGTLAGVVGAVVSYQSVTGSEAAVQRPVSAPVVAEPSPTVTTKLLPCEKGTKLVKGVCVRTKNRVIVRDLPAPALAAAAARGTDRSPRAQGDDDNEPTKIPTSQSPRYDDDAYEGDHDDDRDEDRDDDRDDDRDEDRDDDRDEGRDEDRDQGRDEDRDEDEGREDDD